MRNTVMAALAQMELEIRREHPGPWEGELPNMWKPTNVDNPWIHGGNLHQSRHFSNSLALQLKAGMEGLPTPVFERQPTHHTR